jgi:hypothetical protein
MKRALTALVLVVALPLSASASDLVIEIDDMVITSMSGNPEGDIRADIVGTFLNVVIGEFDGPPDQEGFAGETSVEVPADATRAVVSPDGSVSFTVADPMTTPVVVDLPPVEDEIDVALVIESVPVITYPFRPLELR